MLKEAMIFAAGLGTRFRPMTDNLPKPLVEVGGRAMLDWQIETCFAAGVEKIIINCFYLSDMILSHVQKKWASKNIILEIEDERLETGGGVKNCLKYIDGEHFFTVNSDIIFPNYKKNNPLEIMYTNFLKHEKPSQCLLMVADKNNFIGYNGNGDFILQKGILKRSENNQVTYLGAQIISRDNFTNIDEKVFSLTKIFNKLEAENSLCGIKFEDVCLDIGNIESYNLAIEFFNNQKNVSK